MRTEYAVNEIFRSIQGEGVRAGTLNVFVRFQGCNLRCNKAEHGFDCDTEWTTGKKMTAVEIVKACGDLRVDGLSWIILTGGEPGLQVDNNLVDRFKDEGWKLAIETNGTVQLPTGQPDNHVPTHVRDFRFDWITVSPKSAAHTITQRYADELKFVRNVGQELPTTYPVTATHHLVSPAFSACGVDGRPIVDQATMDHCVKLVHEHPNWRLSVQMHKFFGIR